MSIPLTDITFSDIYGYANNSGPPGMVSLNTMSFFSWFEGPNGSGTLPDVNWGQGEGSGANRIFGTTAKVTNIKVSDFAGLDYYYVNPQYSVDLRAANNCPPPTTPPDPPDVFDFNVNLTMYDSGLSFPYLSYGFLLNQGGGLSTVDIAQLQPPLTVPLINSYYWVLTIQTSPMYPGVGGNRTVDLYVNGTLYLSGLTINNGANSWDYITYGTPVITRGATASTVDTGSFWDITIL
jgi:hypothetical protein